MSEFDKNLEPGDLIRAYHKGIWKVTSVERRFYDGNDEEKKGDEYASLIYYVAVADANGKRRKSKSKKCCDAGFVTKLDTATVIRELEEEEKKAKEKYEALILLLKEE